MCVCERRYAASSPILCVFAAAYFLLSWGFWRYAMLYFFERCYESGVPTSTGHTRPGQQSLHLLFPSPLQLFLLCCSYKIVVCALSICALTLYPVPFT